MPLTTGTASNYASEFHYPSGTVVYAAQVIGFPEIMDGKREITNHGGGGFREWEHSGLISVGEFTVQILGVGSSVNSMFTDMKNKTKKVIFLKCPVYTYLFTGLVSSIKVEDADGTSPDSVKATITVQPTGELTLGNA